MAADRHRLYQRPTRARGIVEIAFGLYIGAILGLVLVIVAELYKSYPW